MTREYDCTFFKSLTAIRDAGFDEPVSIGQLLEDCYSRSDGVMRGSTAVPTKKGLYMVLHPCDFKAEFVLAGKNGFMGGNPRAGIEYLGRKWVHNTIVTYIGQTGGGSSAEVLRERIRIYLRHGLKGKGGHKGGRLIWHISDPTELVLCWKKTVKGDPERLESHLLDEFENCYGKLPFGNIKRGKIFVDDSVCPVNRKQADSEFREVRGAEYRGLCNGK